MTFSCTIRACSGERGGRAHLYARRLATTLTQPSHHTHSVIRERQANWSPTPQYLNTIGEAFSEIASRFELYTDYLKNQGPLMEVK